MYTDIRAFAYITTDISTPVRMLMNAEIVIEVLCTSSTSN